MKSIEPAFRHTPAAIRICPESILLKQKSLWMGSCFTENMSPWLQGLGYEIESNSFGVVYHPMMILKLLHARADELFPYSFERDGVWLNFLTGSAFAARSESELSDQLVQAAERCQSALRESNWLVLTFGSAFLYHHHALGPVGKCHKLPASGFEKKLSSVGEISQAWVSAIEFIRKQKPDLKVLLSLSPVRHSRDGLEENAVSKSILRVSISEICRRLPSIYYFPAWEIMTDELRDYRFYAADLVHPSGEAIAYLQQQFELRFLHPEEGKIRQLARELQQLRQHRPQAEWSPAYRQWQEHIQEKEELLRKAKTL
jgi:hypothetical protein